MKKITKLLFVISILSSIVIAQENYRPLFRIYENGLYGFIDSTGQVIIPPKYRSAGEFSEGLAPVRENGYYGYIDESGKYVITPQYDYAEPFDNEYAIVFIDSYPNYIDKKGLLLTHFKCSQILPFIDDYAIVYTEIIDKNRKAGVINKNGFLIIDTLYSEILDYNDGLFIFKQPYNQYGVIDYNNNIIVPAGKFSTISQFHNGFAKVTYNPPENSVSSLRYQGFINTSGDIALELDNTFYYEIADIVNTDSLFIAEAFNYESVKNSYAIGNRMKGGLMNLKGEWVMIDSNNYRFAYLDEKLCTIDTNGICKEIDKNGKKTGRGFFYYHNNTYSFLNFGPEKDPKKELKYGIIDTNFNFVVKPFFELNWYTGIIDGLFAYGKYLTDENDNYIPVGDGTNANVSKIGICRIDGKIIHEPTFETVDHNGYVNGLILVKENGKPAYINKEGEKVWQQKENVESKINDLNIDYQLMTWFTEGRYNFGWSPIFNIPFSDFDDNVEFKENDVSIILSTEKTLFNGKNNGYSLFLVNDMENFVSAPSVDGALYMVLQAKDKFGNWKNIESFPGSSCGNSYVHTKINSKSIRKYSVPKYSGELKTKIRAVLHIYGTQDKLKYIYSNEIDGSINPAQFWRALGIFRSSSLLEK